MRTCANLARLRVQRFDNKLALGGPARCPAWHCTLPGMSERTRDAQLPAVVAERSPHWELTARHILEFGEEALVEGIVSEQAVAVLLLTREVRRLTNQHWESALDRYVVLLRRALTDDSALTLVCRVYNLTREDIERILSEKDAE